MMDSRQGMLNIRDDTTVASKSYIDTNATH